mmetsp:Transcript_38624/g.90746  ORF Transcript_38624/g.90746 Transcript_38624/m.90746 type:complete len:681 (-) Transcript_38624:116-2158(-)
MAAAAPAAKAAAGAAKQQPKKVWVWSAVDGSSGQFVHPADLPASEAASHKCWTEGRRGPRVAKISPATSLESRGEISVVEQNGVRRELHKSMVLPWYEGLLLLDEQKASRGQDGFLQASWASDSQLGETLEEERKRFRNLSAAFYTEKQLLNVAITGAECLDMADKKFSYRRENLRPEDCSHLPEGDPDNPAGFFSVKDVLDYCPPWQAFYDEKCGFYQDFYLVQWASPFSEVDYTSCENGSAQVRGATWEPDECLPACLDALRIAAKEKWIKRRREVEQARKRVAESPLQDESTKRQAKASPDAATKVNGTAAEEASLKQAPVLKRLKRNGAPLNRDIASLAIGHDFDSELDQSRLLNIRSGWPRTKEEYPQGYSCCDPPGLCFKECDCMDDQRAQKSWEIMKKWLESAERTAAAQSSVDAFMARTDIAHQRGQVSRMFHIEAVGPPGDAITQAPLPCQAAQYLACSACRRIQEVMRNIPMSQLTSSDGAIHIPPGAFFTPEEGADTTPLTMEATLASGESLPAWLAWDCEAGALSLRPGHAPTLFHDLELTVTLSSSEGALKTGSVVIKTEVTDLPAWFQATRHLVERLNQTVQYPLEPVLREKLFDQLSAVWNLKQDSPRMVPVNRWFQDMGKVLKMLRAAAVSPVVVTEKHGDFGFGQGVLAKGNARPTPPAQRWY